jgi:PBP1b-binding outer membrane lipoprotein LpoB
MKATLPFALTMVLTACAAGTAPPPAYAPPPHVIVQHAPKQQNTPVPPIPLDSSDSPDPATSKLTPKEIVVVAEQAKADAAGYVAWKDSKNENIDRLTTLTVDLNNAVATMRANEHDGTYRAADVLNARTALHELRRFLATKDD